MSDVTILVKAGFKARKAFRNWRDRVRVRKGEKPKQSTEGNPMDGFIWQFVEKGIRHGAGWVGGLLTANGLATDSEAQAMAGALAGLGALIWSVGRAWWRKRKGLAASGMVAQ